MLYKSHGVFNRCECGIVYYESGGKDYSRLGEVIFCDSLLFFPYDNWFLYSSLSLDGTPDDGSYNANLEVYYLLIFDSHFLLLGLLSFNACSPGITAIHINSLDL